MDLKSLMSQIQGAPAAYERETAPIRADLAKSTAAVEAMRTRQQAERAPVVDRIKAKTAEELPKYEPKELPTFNQEPMDTKAMGETVSLISALAAMGGLLTRQPLTAALNNFSAGVQGYVQGDEKAYKRNLDEFKLNFDKAKTENDELYRKAQAARQAHGTELQSLLNEMNVVAAEHQDQILSEMLKRQDIVSAQEWIGKKYDMFNKTNSSLATMMAQIEARETAHKDRMAAMSMASADRRAIAGIKAGPQGAENTGGVSDKYLKDPEYKQQVDFWAQYLADGNSLPPRFAQSGAGKAMYSDIVSTVPTLAGGDSKALRAGAVELAGQKAQARSLGTRSAAIEQAASEAREMSQIVLDTSAAFDRTNFQPINKALAAYQTRSGGTEVRQFGAAVNSYINAYARAVNPSGVATVSDKEHAREMLSTADSPDQVKAIISVLDREMTAAQNSPRNVKDSLRREITGAPAPAGGHGAQTPKASTGKTINFADLPP